MNRKTFIQQGIFFLLFSIFLAKCFSVNVEYYGVNSTSSDIEKITMTQDLLYTQLLSFPGVTVTDKRDQNYSSEIFIDDINLIVVYADIQDDSTEWVFTIYAEQPALQKKSEITKTYASYYKILTEAKESLRKLLDSITNQDDQNSKAVTSAKPASISNTTPTLELISGTWVGEKNISKIVLLRGGRGFVIFQNGATMNIDVEIQENTVICTQTGKSNASFFPDLPREIALVAALDAEPIKWTLNLTDENTLNGTKKTLAMSTKENSVSATELKISQVTWTKQ